MVNALTLLPLGPHVGDIENRPKTDIERYQIKRVPPTNTHIHKAETI